MVEKRDDRIPKEEYIQTTKEEIDNWSIDDITPNEWVLAFMECPEVVEAWNEQLIDLRSEWGL